MKIAIVTTDLYGMVRNGGVGTSVYHFADLFKRSGHDVDVIFANAVYDYQNVSVNFFKKIYSEKKINVVFLHDLNCRIENGYFAPTTSYLCYLKLKDRHYDRIFFNDLGGLGYYSLLSQKLSIAFPRTQITLLYHGPTKWHHQHNQSPVDKYTDVVLEAIERLTLEAADEVIFATQSALKSAQELGYKIPKAHSHVCMFPFDYESSKAEIVPILSKKKELVFFGRLEKRKGLFTFLEAVIKNKNLFIGGFVNLTFLGSVRVINGIRSDQFILDWARKNNISIQILTQADSQFAVEYLKKTNSIAVLASTAETLGYTLAECIINGIPYINSNITSFDEIHRFFKIKPQFEFKAESAESLSNSIRNCLARWPERSEKHIPNKFRALQIKQWNSVLKNKIQIRKPAAGRFKPTITIAIPVIERAVGLLYFKELIASIKKLNEMPKEILILANGMSAASLNNLKKAAAGIPHVKIIKSFKKLNVSQAKNRLARHCKTDYIFFLDDDNALHHLNYDLYIKKILNSRTDVIVNTLQISSSANQKLRRPTRRIFLSPEPALNLIDNLSGDGNFIVNKDFFIKIGGFNPRLNFGEDQDFLLKCHIQGGRYIIAPEPLVVYRQHSDSLTAQSQFEDRQTKLIQALSQSFGQPRSFETFHSFLFHAFQNNDAVNGQSASIENYARNNLKPALPSKSSQKIFKKHFSNKLKKSDQILYLIPSNQAISKGKVTPSLKVELHIHSSHTDVLKTSSGEIFQLFTGANRVVCNVYNEAQISMFTLGQNTQIAFESAGYVKDLPSRSAYA